MGTPAPKDAQHGRAKPSFPATTDAESHVEAPALTSEPSGWGRLGYPVLRALHTVEDLRDTSVGPVGPRARLASAVAEAAGVGSAGPVSSATSPMTPLSRTHRRARTEKLLRLGSPEPAPERPDASRDTVRNHWTPGAWRVTAISARDPSRPTMRSSGMTPERDTVQKTTIVFLDGIFVHVRSVSKPNSIALSARDPDRFTFATTDPIVSGIPPEEADDELRARLERATGLVGDLGEGEDGFNPYGAYARRPEIFEALIDYNEAALRGENSLIDPQIKRADASQIGGDQPMHVLWNVARSGCP